MLLSSNKKAPVSNTGKIETIISAGTEMRGEIKAVGNLRIDGFFEGHIVSEGSLYIGKNGQICGDITAQSVIVGGKVTGNVEATDKLEILTGGQLIGDIRARQVIIAEGVVFEGHCDMGLSTKRSTAQVEILCDENKIEYDFNRKKIELKKMPLIKAE